METLVYGKPILNSVLTLKSLMQNFEAYTKELAFTGDDASQYEEVLETMDLLDGSMKQIALAKSSLESLIEKMKLEYDSKKSKEEKRLLLQQMEDTENDTNFNEVLKQATEFHFMLSTRRTEANSRRKRLARKLGISIPIDETSSDYWGRKQKCASNEDVSLTSSQGNHDRDRAEEGATGLAVPHPTSESSSAIPPPRVKLPQFFGNEAEWPEFWAIYDTLVHRNPSLSTIEKMLLLKDSLRGKSDRAVKGIQLVPQNYEWMIETLRRKYENKTANRARIVQQLNSLQKANDSAKSNEYTYDKICMLLNQMVSTGQDIRPTKDAMWTEAILKKFPRHIVESVLVKMKDHDEVTVEELMAMIGNEIAAKSYIESRTDTSSTISEFSARVPPKPARVTEKTTASPSSLRCALCEKQGHPPWQCQSSLTIAERRKIVLAKRLCWKCYSSYHSSKECHRGNCPLCGQLHDKHLCFSSVDVNTSTTNAQIISRRSENQQHNMPPNSQQKYSSRNTNGAQSKNAHDSRRPENLQQGRNAPTRAQRSASRGEVIQNYASVDYSHMKQIAEQIVLMTAEGSVWNTNSEKYDKAIFFFDTGAQKTVIQEDFARKLGLPNLKRETCIMSGIGGNMETFESNIVHLKVGTAFGKDLEILIQTKPVLTRGFPAVKLSSLDQDFLQERHLLVCNPCIRGEHQVPNIIVGLDHYYSFVLDNGEAMVTPSGLRMAKTIFGPTLYGRGSTDASDHAFAGNVAITYGMTAITEQELLNNIFELDGMGISSDELADSHKFLDYFKTYSRQISFENGYLTAPFPLKPNIVDLTDNYPTAIRRLISLHLQLEKNAIQKEWYCKILKQYEADDIIEEVSGQTPNSVGIYYMPHSGVWRPHKPKPLRIVFDASSKKKGHLSLNDVTLKGEALMNKIHDILIASRTSKIIMTCDIEAAFTQIRLLEAHKDLCRFLWLKNPSQAPTHDNIVEYRFKRVPFGVKPSPSILNMCLLAFLQSKTSPLSKEILDNLYVDNILLKADSPDEAISKYKESKKLFAEIGMNLREYVSNCHSVNERIPEQDRAPSGVTKLLGVQYNTKADRFHLKLTFDKKSTLSKRDIVSQLNSVYDPIGVASPLTVTLKHLMREIYDTGVEWKAPIAENLALKWRELCDHLNNTSISIPRYVDVFTGDTTLWVFADASAKALAVCAFARGDKTGKITQLISGKTRLTPKKTRQTIPRLETLALLMAVRLARTIKSASKTKYRAINILSDSEIALSWLKSSKDLPIFVENQKHRIMQVKNAIEADHTPVNFYYVPTEDNPADAGTRGIAAQDIHDHPWINGPTWLKQETFASRIRILHDIPTSEPVMDEQTPEDDSLLANYAAITEETSASEFVDLSRFSRWNTAIRTAARVCKTLRNWIIRVNNKREDRQKISVTVINHFDAGPEITTEDFRLSESLLIAQAHKTISLKSLQKRFPQKKILRDHDGIIRNVSRLQNAHLTYDTKNPIFVEKDSDLARLILTDIHAKNAHCGKDHTLCLARQRFWIPRPSGAFKRFVKPCVICKKSQGLPFGAPEMPPLPCDRVILTKPFQTTGCDFMGPYTSTDDKKFYVCLYTCLTTRAIHLEVVEDMSATAFLNSFIRFISRRGVPKLIRTDCGTNFKLGQQVINFLFEHDSRNSDGTVMTYSVNRGIQWLFNPPGAPWMGGAWERLVGTVKRAFSKAIGRRKLSHSELYTVVTQIEAIVNTRPLTSISNSVDDIPIRPVDFLEKSLKYSLASGDADQRQDPSFDPDLIKNVSEVKQALEHVESITTKFWEKWHTDYLTALRELQVCQRNQPRHAKFREPKINEIVLVEHENLPRGSWCYGKVTELVRSSDGLVRSVKLLMPNKHIWHRPVNKLYPLEIPPTSETSSEIERSPEQESDVQSRICKANRPPRAAKQKALKAIAAAAEERDKTTMMSHSYTFIPLSNHVLIAMFTLMILTQSVTPAPHIHCESNSFRVNPPLGKFELCIKATCNIFENITEELVFPLPATTKNASLPISMKYYSENVHKEARHTCALPDVCQLSQTILSKSLIGNPHCRPVGAILSIGLFTYVVFSAVVVTIRIVLMEKDERDSLLGIKTLHTADRSSISEAPSEAEAVPRERANNVNIRLTTFRPKPLGSAGLITLLAVASYLASLPWSAIACQQGYTRHNVELVCDSQRRCTFVFNREILFNEITNMVCISLLHQNKTIGAIQVKKLPVELLCAKRTLFFTRDTDYVVYSATRCALKGSCIDDACSKITPNSQINELGNATEYPGYTGCEPSCGGLLCGCLLPLPSCSFYRVANVPKNNAVYEIARCVEWKPTARLFIRIALNNKIVQKSLTLRPYVTHTFENNSITVVSISKPTCSLLTKRFALTKGETLVVPDQVKLPVQCPTVKDAQKDFKNCKNKLICDCDVEATPARCNCPSDSITNIRADVSNVFPLSSPFVKLISKNGAILAISSREEMTVAIQSTYMNDSAEYVTQQNCSIHLKDITGCYSCQEGASVEVSCRTELPTWVVIQCYTHIFSVPCHNLSATTTVALDFQNAVVNQECHSECSKSPIVLRGTLAYVTHTNDNDIFYSHQRAWKGSESWLSDWKMPDLHPILLTIKAHFKTTIALFSTFALIAIATYILGPTALLLLIRVVIHCFSAFMKVLFVCVTKILAIARNHSSRNHTVITGH